MMAKDVKCPAACLHRQARTLVEIVIVIAIILLLLGITVPLIATSRAAAERVACKNNLAQIGVSLHLFHDHHKCLPPGVTSGTEGGSFPFMGWQTRLLPYLGYDSLWELAINAYSQTEVFSKNPPHPSNFVISVFGCPSDPRLATPSKFGTALTSYLGLEGTNQFKKDGLLFLSSQIRFSDISDGLTNTLMVGERPPSADERLGWWYAGWGQNKDGSAEMVLGVQERTTGKWSLICPSGPFDFQPGFFTNQCDAFHFWSPHPGGAHFLFADGSVRFLDYSAAPLLPALATRAGGEVVALPE